jgi:hypothetical protein
MKESEPQRGRPYGADGQNGPMRISKSTGKGVQLLREEANDKD